MKSFFNMAIIKSKARLVVVMKDFWWKLCGL